MSWVNALFPEEGWLARAKAAYTGQGATPNQLFGPPGDTQFVSNAEGKPFVPVEQAKRAERMTRAKQQGEDLLGFVGGLRAWHGSPHIFDKFSMRHMGSGEGAQAYGKGLYFAQNPNVAKGYREALSGPANSGLMLDGKPIENFTKNASGIMNEAEAAKAGIARPDQYWIYRWKNSGLSKEDFLREFKHEMPTADRVMLEKIFPRFEMTTPKKPGALYEVDLDVKPNMLLDLDVPFKQQTKDVRKAYPLDARIAATLEAWTNGKLTPTVELSPDRFAAIQQLRDRGIPGAQYYDRGSRAAQDGSRNYVIWDDRLINILKRYGVLGPVGAGVVNQLTGGQSDTQEPK